MPRAVNPSDNPAAKAVSPPTSRPPVIRTFSGVAICISWFREVPRSIWALCRRKQKVLAVGSSAANPVLHIGVLNQAARLIELPALISTTPEHFKRVAKSGVDFFRDHTIAQQNLQNPCRSGVQPQCLYRTSQGVQLKTLHIHFDDKPLALKSVRQGGVQSRDRHHGIFRRVRLRPTSDKRGDTAESIDAPQPALFGNANRKNLCALEAIFREIAVEESQVSR